MGLLIGKKAGGLTPASLGLDGLEVQRARLLIAVSAHVIGQALARRWRSLLAVPVNGDSLEASIHAAVFELALATPIIDVDRVDCAKTVQRAYHLFPGTRIRTRPLGDYIAMRKARLSA